MSESKKSYLGPFITMVFLFFVIGFLTVLNQQFQGPLKSAFLSQAGDLQNTLSTMLTFAFFLAFPIMGGIGSKWVDAHGYKKTLIRALFILIGGFVLFEASAFYTTKFDTSFSFSGGSIPMGYFIFLLGSFVVGTAITILQVVVNPYLIASQVKGTSDIQRQSIGGSANSIGTTIAPFFVSYLVFSDVEDVQVGDVFIPFAALAGAVLVLIFVISRLSLPTIEGTTESDEDTVGLEKSVWSFSHLALGVLGLFFYVGVEVCVGANINLFAESLDGFTAKDGAKMASLYWGGMLVGRLIGSVISKVPAKIQLVVTSIASATLVLLSMVLHNPWLLVAVGLFHSIMWPAIFSLAIKDLGKYTSKASGTLMIGVIGGAILPLLQGGLADIFGDWSLTWIIVIVGEAYLLYYALIGSKVKQKG